MNSGSRINDYMRRAGITQEQRHTDPQLHYTDRMLRSILTIVEIALQDEDVDPQVIDRVIRTVIFGAVPTEADVQARIDERREAVARAETYPPPRPFNLTPFPTVLDRDLEADMRRAAVEASRG